MRFIRKKAKFSNIALILIVACIASFLLINRINSSKTTGLSVTEQKASASDSRYLTTEAGYSCRWETQHNGYVCYAYSICAAMEADVYIKYGENVNFKETHIVNEMNSGTTGSSTTGVWNTYLSAQHGPVSDDSSEVHSYNATGIERIDNNVAATKSAIIQYGGLDAGVNWSESNSYRTTTSDGSMAQCTPASSGIGIGHGVTILGWDDNYPKENFPAACGVTENGAFYTYNPANGGVLWVSYQDRNIMEETYGIDMVKIEEYVPQRPQFSTDGLTINDIPYGNQINIEFTGSEVTALVTAFFNTDGVQLHEGTDFNVTYSPNGAVGTFQMYLNGMGDYEGQQLVQNLTITPKDIAQITVEIESVNNDNTVNVRAEYNGHSLSANSDYVIEYLDSSNAGKKIAKISGRGNYNGWVEREFTLNTEPEVNPPTPQNPDNLSITVKDFRRYAENDKIYVVDISENTSITSVINGITTNGTVEVYDGETKITDNSSKVKTGMKLKITKNTEVVELNLVVNGDVTGDGIIDGRDLMKVSRYVSKADTNLSGAYLVAANVHEATKNTTVDNNDSLRISRYLISLENNLK